ncbi:Protein-tyrosine sulfotransferase, partial [Paragonimus westermani]
FLGIPWDPVVLQHEVVLTNLTGLNPYEPSTKQVIHKIYTDSLAQWTGPDSVLDMEFIQTAHQESRLLQLLGYANVGNPPNYDALPSSIPIFRF